MLADNNYWQIWRIDLNGQDLTQLTFDNIDKRYPCVLPDGKVIFVTNKGSLFTMDLDGKNLKQVPLKIKATQVKASSDANKIVFTSFYNEFNENSDIWLLDLDVSKLTKAIRRPWMQLEPVFMDDKAILFVDAPELGGYEIYKFNLENSDTAQLTQNDFYDIAPVFSGKTKKIAFASDREGTFDIFIMDEFGQGADNLTRNNFDERAPCFSSKGSLLYFLSNASGRYQIYKTGLNKEEAKQVFLTDADILDFSVVD